MCRSLSAFVFICALSAAALAQSTPAVGCMDEVIPYDKAPAVKGSKYVLDLVSGGNRLYYFGGEHSSDPAHPQFVEIEKAWSEVKPTVAFYEGPDRGIGSSAEETIAKVGESGFVRFLAARDGIPFKSLEPSPHAEAAYVMTKYSAEETLLFYVLRETSRLRERKKLPEEELKEAIAQMLGKISKINGFETLMPDLAALQTAYAKHWKEPAQWWLAPGEWFDPAKSAGATGGKFTNDINRMSSYFRDRYMSGLLSGSVLEGNRAFAVVGWSHVPMQEPALRCGLSSSR